MTHPTIADAARSDVLTLERGKVLTEVRVRRQGTDEPVHRNAGEH
jgi:hypothetical protein